MLEINLWAVLVCAVLSMVLGFVWYGPLFGKKWMDINDMSDKSPEEQKKMQKSANFLYIIQFCLSLFQAYVLAHYIAGWKEVSGLENALWIWAGFIMPVVAQASMWNSDSRKVSLTRFAIQGGYQLVLFIIFGLVLGMWK